MKQHANNNHCSEHIYLESKDNKSCYAKPCDNTTNYDDLPRLKVVAVGDGGSGKTSLYTVFTQRDFPQAYVPTVCENQTAEVEFHTKKLFLLLWDTAGQEDYDRLRPLSYDNSDVIMICYDVMCPASFENVQVRWFPEIRHFCADTPTILVGCKIDLRQDNNEVKKLNAQNMNPVTAEMGTKLAEEIGAVHFIECSARTKENVDNLFRCVTTIGLAEISKDKKRRNGLCDGLCFNCTVL